MGRWWKTPRRGAPRERERPPHWRPPDPFDSDRSFARFYHQDLPGLSDLDLYRELHQAKAAIAWAAARRDLPWFFERLAELRAEALRRGTPT